MVIQRIENFEFIILRKVCYTDIYYKMEKT